MKYLDIDTSKRLRKLGAFEDRGWQVGDCYSNGFDKKIIVDICNYVASQIRYGRAWAVLDTAMKFENDERIALEELSEFDVLLPTLTDLLEEIRRITGNNTIVYQHEKNTKKLGIWACVGNLDNLYDGTGETYVEATAACLIKILEAKEREG